MSLHGLEKPEQCSPPLGETPSLPTGQRSMSFCSAKGFSNSTMSLHGLEKPEQCSPPLGGRVVTPSSPLWGNLSLHRQGVYSASSVTSLILLLLRRLLLRLLLLLFGQLFGAIGLDYGRVLLIQIL